MMKKVKYILVGMWLFTIVLSNLLLTTSYFDADNSKELSKKSTKEAPEDDNTDENEKKSEDKTDERSEKKTENEESNKFFEALKFNDLYAKYAYFLLIENIIHSADEQYICNHTIDLESPPPEV